MRLQRLLVLVASLLLIGAASALANEHHVNATLSAVGGSGVSGRVELTALPHGGAVIHVTASGLRPGTAYLSLYYDNGRCEVEPYEPDDVIDRYTADAAGEASVTAKVGDDLDEIHSVSVRLQSDFPLQACAWVQPKADSRDSGGRAAAGLRSRPIRGKMRGWTPRIHAPRDPRARSSWGQ